MSTAAEVRDNFIDFPSESLSISQPRFLLLLYLYVLFWMQVEALCPSSTSPMLILTLLFSTTVVNDTKYENVFSTASSSRKKSMSQVLM